jgi:hypothetical protein
MIYYFLLIIFVFSVVVLFKYENASKKLILTLLTFTAISVIGLSINNGEGWKKTLFSTHEKTISKEIKVERLLIKDENSTIILDGNYKILISKQPNNYKYKYEVYRNDTKLENVRSYGFHEILSSIDKIKNDSYRLKVTFDFSENGGELEWVYFKLVPNDIEKSY